jgi:hypothetical protein
MTNGTTPGAVPSKGWRLLGINTGGVPRGAGEWENA